MMGSSSRQPMMQGSTSPAATQRLYWILSITMQIPLAMLLFGMKFIHWFVHSLAMQIHAKKLQILSMLLGVCSHSSWWNSLHGKRTKRRVFVSLNWVLLVSILGNSWSSLNMIEWIEARDRSNWVLMVSIISTARVHWMWSLESKQETDRIEF